MARNIRMTAILFTMLLLLPWTHASAEGEKLTYNFDKIDVVYAAEFMMYPGKAEPGHWLTEIAGGTDKPIEVMFGIVNLYNGDSYFDEYFIKMSGPGGSERFLSNSMSNTYYGENNSCPLRQTAVQLWSGKKLDGNAVVKDFSEPIKSVTLTQSFDPQGNVTGFQLQAEPLFIKDSIPGNSAGFVSFYSSDPNTVQQAGVTVTGKEVEVKPEVPKTEEPVTDKPNVDEPKKEDPAIETPATGEQSGSSNDTPKTDETGTAAGESSTGQAEKPADTQQNPQEQPKSEVTAP